MLLAGACGGAAPEPAEPGPAPRIAALLEEAREAERVRRHDRARALYEQAVREAPDRTSEGAALRELASALLFWGEVEAAGQALERLVVVAPDEVSGWHDLGIVRARRGDPAGAERALRRAAAMAPADPRPRIALAALLVTGRRWDEALAEYRGLQRLRLPERMRRAVARAIELLEAERAR